jgi:hypothetical protein
MTGKEFIKKYVKKGKILPNNVEVINGTLDFCHKSTRAGAGFTKIENLPKVINGNLWLSSNKITKIENLPKLIEGDLYLHNNKITKIENLPEVIEGDLDLSGNNNIAYISPFCLCKRKDILLKYFKEEELKEFTRKLI